MSKVIKTWEFDSRNQAPTLQRGTIIEYYGYAMCHTTLVCVNPETGRCLEIARPGDYMSTEHCPEHFMELKHIRSVKEKFGIGHYVNEDAPLASNAVIQDAEDYCELWKQFAADEKAKAEKEFSDEQTRLKARYPYLKVNPEYGEIIDNVREYLKHEYPSIKCTVKRESGAWVDSLRVTVYTELKEVVRDIEGDLSRFRSGHFNGMTDSYDRERTPFNTLFGDVEYISAYMK